MKKQTVLFSAFLALSASVFSGATQADDSQALQQKLAGLTTFSSNFNQQVFDDQNTLLEKSQGKLELARAKKIRWQQTTPEETLFVSDGLNSYYYDSFAEQVTLLDTSNLIASTPFILLTTNEARLWQQYKVEKTASGFEITPKDKLDAQIEKLTIGFNQNNEIASLTIADRSGQHSVFSFTQPVQNKKIAETQFQFTPPEGVFIDDQRPVEINTLKDSRG